jgi:hypothetical protein
MGAFVHEFTVGPLGMPFQRTLSRFNNLVEESTRKAKPDSKARGVQKLNIMETKVMWTPCDDYTAGNE